MARINDRWFARPAADVAKDLLGRELVLEHADITLRARLREVAAYEGQEKTTSEGAALEPGQLSISCKFGNYLVDVATGENGDYSCVTLRGADFTATDSNGNTIDDLTAEVRGPGNFSSTLGVNKETKWVFELLGIGSQRLYVEGDSVPRDQIKERKKNADNCKGIFYF
jgi:3-methyladenine DNA glycosylase Mpg